MPRLKLVLAYVGTAYCGWQLQAWKDREQPPTIQGELERAMEKVVGAPVRVQGAGRTDTGVHADAQVAHCDIPESRTGMAWQKILNAHLPRDIRVLDAQVVDPRFQACFQANRKAYTYTLWLNPRYTLPKRLPFVWACGPLNLAQLDAAIPHFLGEHDFRSLQNAGTEMKNTVRRVLSIVRSPYDPAHGADYGWEMTLRFEANGFLKQMVRNMVGVLVACGRGRMEPAAIPALLAACDRRKAPPTAPPSGLSLTRIWYGDEWASQGEQFYVPQCDRSFIPTTAPGEPCELS